MTALSAKVAQMAESVVEVQTIGWFSRLAAVIEIMKLCNKREGRLSMIKGAWTALNGNVARDLERGLTNSQMAALRSTIPSELGNGLSGRSSRIPLYALLWEVGNPKAQTQHTVLRGLRRGFGRAREVAKSVTLREKVGWRASSEAEWIKGRLAVLREFWAVQYAALSQVVHIARYLRNDLRWWVELSSSVNLFRAGVMRGIDVARPSDSVALTVGNVPLRMIAYHSASHLRKTLEPLIPEHLPLFRTNDNLTEWATQLAWHTVDVCKEQTRNIPRIGKQGPASAHTHHFTRGAFLLAKEDVLGEWIDKTIELVGDDCVALLEQRDAIREASAPASATPMNAAMEDALAQASADMAESFARIATPASTGSETQYIIDNVNEDAWDDFLCATHDTSDPHHQEAVTQHDSIKRCTDKAAAEALIRWVNGVFMENAEESAATII